VAKLKKSSTAKTTAKAKPKRGYAKGGSTVNAAGNYTKPSMRKSLVASVKAGGKGGSPGQWSRKAQMVAKQYKAKGGGYT
jgi:hypothetical protein